MYCVNCGTQIKEGSKFCHECGAEQNIVANAVSINTSSHAKVKQQSVLKIILVCLTIIILAVIAAFVAIKFINGMNSTGQQTVVAQDKDNYIEGKLEMVESLYAMNYFEILSQYPEAELLAPNSEVANDLSIAGEFAGLAGSYRVCVLDDGSVWRVIFEPLDESLADDSVVDVIKASLGDYIEYDSEWNCYTWRTDSLEIEYWIDERTYFDWIGEDIEVNEIAEDNHEVEISSDSSEYSDIEEISEQERSEADDYDEFKSAVEECIRYVPNCDLDLNYTDSDNSYSINLGDEIVGIFGTGIESWDAVALTDPDKEDALLHHEQISIALIMACDTDITYEDAKAIFDEAKDDGSAMISSGKYFFEGMAEGMYAGGVDILWLD